MPCIDIKATGQKIKDICNAKGFTAPDIADMIGVTKIAVYKWFRGDAIPSIDNFVVFAAIVGKKIDDIIVLKTI